MSTERAARATYMMCFLAVVVGLIVLPFASTWLAFAKVAAWIVVWTVLLIS